MAKKVVEKKEIKKNVILEKKEKVVIADNKADHSFDFKDSDSVVVIALGSAHLKKDSEHVVGGALAKVLIKKGVVKLKK